MNFLSKSFLLIIFSVLPLVYTYAGPEISFENKEIDYGSIEQGSNGIRHFTFTNTGDEPLIIYSCIATCSCYHANCPEELIMPGEQGKIEAVYDTKKIGSFAKSITVSANAEGTPLRLMIKGEVLEPTTTD